MNAIDRKSASALDPPTVANCTGIKETPDNELLRIAHPTLRLDDLAPGKSPAFSPNLFKYMRRRGHFFRYGGTIVDVFVIREGSRAAKEMGAGTLMLGFVDGPFFSGVRLMEALCQGAQATSMAYAISASVEPVPGFWDDYLVKGRCAIDPTHSEYFIGDRYSTAGNVRTCLWCGAQHIKVETPRVVTDTSWVSTDKAAIDA